MVGVKPIEDRRTFAIGLMIAAFLCYTIIDSFAKLMVQAGLPSMEVVFVRYAGQFILVLALASWLIFSEPPDVWFYVGAPIIIGSGVYIWFRERQLNRTVTVAPVED